MCRLVFSCVKLSTLASTKGCKAVEPATVIFSALAVDDEEDAVPEDFSPQAASAKSETAAAAIKTYFFMIFSLYKT